jgi:outer membrane lipoprotein-sorting protein
MIFPHMRRFLTAPRFVTAIVFAFAFFPLAALGQSGGDLKSVLSQMDTAAHNFKSAQADFEWDQYQLVIQDKDVQKGAISFQRKGTDTQMAARINQFNGKPDDKELVYKDGQLEFYQPKIKQITVFSAGANRSQYESFLTLGFGGSGSDLDKNWIVTYQGSDTVDGVKTAKLDLVPREANVKQTFTHVTIWVDPSRAISLKQQFFEPSGDYRLATYSNIRYNTPVAADVFTIKPAPGTQTIHK